MEIEGEDGSRIEIRPGSDVVCGRGSGFRTADPTVSRRHLLLRADESRDEPPVMVSFEVLGRNPVWVRSGGGGGEVRVYRTSEEGEISAGDWVCVSGNQPVWFAVKGIGGGGRDLGSESDGEAEGVCVPPDTDIDPVKEFGFLVIGHEFDHYPKQMLRKVKDWNWFLDEPRKDSDDEDDEPRKRKKRKKVRGHNEGEEDEDWTGESEEEKEDLSRPAKTQKKPTYSTRSRDCKLPANRTKGGDEKKSSQKRASGSRDEDDEAEDEEDEEDETLGGFIVDDDDDAQQEEEDGEDDMEDEEEEEEEEEFVEDDDEED